MKPKHPCSLLPSSITTLALMQALGCSGTQIAQELEDSQRPSLLETWVGETDWEWGLQKACSGILMYKQVFGEREQKTGRERGLHATGYSPAMARSLLAVGVLGEESPRLCCESGDPEILQLCDSSLQRQSSINLMSSYFTNEETKGQRS